MYKQSNAVFGFVFLGLQTIPPVHSYTLNEKTFTGDFYNCIYDPSFARKLVQISVFLYTVVWENFIVEYFHIYEIVCGKAFYLCPGISYSGIVR